MCRLVSLGANTQDVVVLDPVAEPLLSAAKLPPRATLSSPTRQATTALEHRRDPLLSKLKAEFLQLSQHGETPLQKSAMREVVDNGLRVFVAVMSFLNQPQYRQLHRATWMRSPVVCEGHQFYSGCALRVAFVVRMASRTSEDVQTASAATGPLKETDLLFVEAAGLFEQWYKHWQAGLADARDATHYAKMDMDTYCNPAALLLELLPYRGLEVYYGAMVAGEAYYKRRSKIELCWGSNSTRCCPPRYCRLADQFDKGCWPTAQGGFILMSHRLVEQVASGFTFAGKECGFESHGGFGHEDLDIGRHVSRFARPGHNSMNVSVVVGAGMPYCKTNSSWCPSDEQGRWRRPWYHIYLNSNRVSRFIASAMPKPSTAIRRVPQSAARQVDTAAISPRAKGVVMVNPKLLAPWNRFDVLVKWAYASYLLEHRLLEHKGRDPPSFSVAVYLEHVRAFNSFHEAACDPKEKKKYRKVQNQAHSNCTASAKSGPREFLDGFHSLIISMQVHGFQSQGASIPACSLSGSFFFPMGAAHRVAAAIAAGVDRVPVTSNGRKSSSSCPLKSATWDFTFFAERGFHHVYSDWVVQRAIRADPDLHLVHIWPRAVSSGGGNLLAQARAHLAGHCSTDGGVLYEKRVSVNRVALASFLRGTYGDVPWLGAKAKATAAVSGSMGIHAFVVRSNKTNMALCKTELRNLYRLPGDAWKASVHVTDYHEEAIAASQMLFNDNSIAQLHMGRGGNMCRSLAARIATDLVAVGKNVSSMPLIRHDHIVHSSDKLLPDGLLVDTGAVMALHGLRNLTDVDLVWARGESTGPLLTRLCGPRRRTPKVQCSVEYESHNPPTVWFSYHDAASAEDLVHDPTLHGQCSGLKFVSVPQLLRYKRRRFAARTTRAGEVKDAKDVSYLENLMTELTSMAHSVWTPVNPGQCAQLYPYVDVLKGPFGKRVADTDCRVHGEYGIGSG